MVIEMDWSDSLEAKKDFPLGVFGYPVVEKFESLVVDNIQPDDVVLNFGCGKDNLKGLARCRKFIRVDIDKKIKPDYTRLEDVKEKVDVVFARAVIEHLTLGEIKEFFSWCAKNSKTLMFNPPNPWAAYGVFASDYTHKTFLNTRAYGGLLKEAGYKKIDFYRIYNGRFVALRTVVAKLVGLDFAQSFACIAKK